MLLLLVFVLGCVSRAIQSPVNVTVLYETLCPDSVAFITEQLYPAVQQYSTADVIVDFVPFGKGDYTVHPDGSITFTCQHGPEECQGNKVHACAVYHLYYDHVLRLDFVQCAMKEVRPDLAGPECAKQLGLNYRPIEECVSGQLGTDILAFFGDRTRSLESQLTFIPSVIIDGVFDPDVQQESLRNFRLVLDHRVRAKRGSPDFNMWDYSSYYNCLNYYYDYYYGNYLGGDQGSTYCGGYSC
uniref:Gamma-interferon inducible lysosomal thiol reductase n=1 Tax=Timema tahoe TaxID=61484 RepID=A0A7R9FHD4_9NEOP|nr:unnamed protein product [Timema tahoe]